MKSTLVWQLAVPLLLGTSILSQSTLSAAQAAADPKSYLSPGSAGARPSNRASNVYPIEHGYVDARGEMIYYEIIGHGPPLMIVHGGPGASQRLLPALPAAARAPEQAGIYRRARLRTFTKA
jgi:pimeloyl-ACP methyl ester carboxylesterase